MGRLLVIVLENNDLSRLLHEQLYVRISEFCRELTPEYPADLVTKFWLNQFFSDSPAIRIGVTIKEFNIISHAVYNASDTLGAVSVCLNQIEIDKSDKTFLDEAVEYLQKYAVEINASTTSFQVKKGVAALKKKYGYEDVRSVMIKPV